MSNDLVHYFVSYSIPLNGNGIQFFHKDITMKCKYITYYGNCIYFSVKVYLFFAMSLAAKIDFFLLHSLAIIVCIHYQVK